MEERDGQLSSDASSSVIVRFSSESMDAVCISRKALSSSAQLTIPDGSADAVLVIEGHSEEHQQQQQTSGQCSGCAGQSRDGLWTGLNLYTGSWVQELHSQGCWRGEAYSGDGGGPIGPQHRCQWLLACVSPRLCSRPPVMPRGALEQHHTTPH